MLTFAAYCKKVTDLKVNKYHIIRSWVLLICFITGQYMVYAHQHKLIQGSKHTYSHQQSKQTLTEKCRVCDAMHHNNMAINGQVSFTPVIVADYVYKSPVYSFTSLSLILAGGRAPPCC
ncbi:hypothetical protein [Mucilaginibacter xinganensis]|uniref:DUF2946 domain-containing protein n=1 Tax=Mucilaginibacter xinganensis TaxID=1234841 RepID=A0A223NRD7_9SPHI|nr:hypothetical protein [Mucilaginibacter xinganensis]ASU32041.1 hypothetical protein MuYL_0138 [Mucilaginibacter xinganensis]